MALVEVDYTELEPVLDPLEALKPDAPQLHPEGNVLSRQPYYSPSAIRVADTMKIGLNGSNK